MTSYRRNFIPGGSFFFTVNLADRCLPLLTANIDLLRAAFREVRQRHPFMIDAIVVLPEHLHTVWTMPGGDADFAMRWRQIKSAFSRHLVPGEVVSASCVSRAERGIWQRRYWEHTIRDEEDYARHIDYVHINPLKHGLVNRVCDWAPSSFHRHVEIGNYPADWAGDLSQCDDGAKFGERS